MKHPFQLDTTLPALCILFICSLSLFLVPRTAYSATAPGPDGGDYYTAVTVYDWVEISATGTDVSLGDDDLAGPFPIGFPFTFYNTGQTEFYIQSNGLISFAGTNLNNESYCPLPVTEEGVDDFIALMWMDLYPDDGGNIFYQSFGSGTCPYNGYGGACLVVQYQDIPFSYDDDSSTTTFEGILLDDYRVIAQFKDNTAAEHWGEQSITGIQGSAANDEALSWSCGTAAGLYGGLAVAFGKELPVTGFSQSQITDQLCPKLTKNISLNLQNYNTGEAISYVMEYPTSTSATFTGPLSVTLPENTSQSIEVKVVPLIPTGPITETITATAAEISSATEVALEVTERFFDGVASNGLAEQSNLVGAYGGKIWSIGGLRYESEENVSTLVSFYDPTADTWTEVPESSPPFEPNPEVDGMRYSGCMAGNTMYFWNGFSYSQDAPDPTFVAYNVETNTWSDLTGLPGQPDTSLYSFQFSAWAYDPEDKLCILTGGETAWEESTIKAKRVRESNGSSDVFVFDTANKQWKSSLPSFTSGRMAHAAWVFGKGEEKKLCIAGGLVSGSEKLSEEELVAKQKTTQCLPYAAWAGWNMENEDLGPLPTAQAYVGFTLRKTPGGDTELWLFGGLNPYAKEESFLSSTWFFDPETKSWISGPELSQQTVLARSTALDNELYNMGGYFQGSFMTYEKLNLCSPAQGCFPWPMFYPAISGGVQQ